jgi:site-specific recombinase
MSDPLCAVCGHPRSNHPFRHRFVGPSKDDTIKELEAKLAKAVEAAVDAGASLAAAISLLERGGRKAAPSNKMFDQMLVDYRNSLERTRATLSALLNDIAEGKAEIEGSDAP